MKALVEKDIEWSLINKFLLDNEVILHSCMQNVFVT